MCAKPLQRKTLDDLDDKEERIFTLLADGQSLQKIAEAVKCSRQFLMKWLRYTSERYKRYESVREDAAHMLADDIVAGAEMTLERAMQGKATKIEVSAQQLVGQNKKWLAGVWNAKYKDGAQTTVNVDLGSLFLTAMRNPVMLAHEVKHELEAGSQWTQITPTVDALEHQKTHDRAPQLPTTEKQLRDMEFKVIENETVHSQHVASAPTPTKGDKVTLDELIANAQATDIADSLKINDAELFGTPAKPAEPTINPVQTQHIEKPVPQQSRTVQQPVRRVLNAPVSRVATRIGK
ncbi:MULTISPECIES: hypothetical protein [Burkholderia]|uniref:terminase small subunit-like protein n=1 Tax=Burkholderia TaxID=32008 RepID=UPI0005D93B5F|nr:hypothetical protein [Burkholderia vietnamiensis]AJY05124.1 helix-turn-helix domain of resolvase family protein [Burkholderia vietnamiensis LMG 10929]UBI27558.1 hypothetical protein LA325_15360 [Burkholderia vietnamiensis]